MNHRLKLVVVLILTTFTLNAQKINTKDFFVADSNNELWQEVLKLENKSDINKANEIIESGLKNLEKGIMPEANLMIVSNTISFLLENSSQFSEFINILDSAESLFVKNSDTLNYAFADYRKTRAMYYRYQRQARPLLSEFEKSYYILTKSCPNHPAELTYIYNLIQANFINRNTLKGFEYFKKLVDLSKEQNNIFYLLSAYQSAANIVKFNNPNLASLFFEFTDFVANKYNQIDFIDNTFYYLSLGSGYTATDQHEKALESYLKGLEVFKKNESRDSDFKANLYYYIGVSYKNLGDYNNAILYLDTAAQIELSKQRSSMVDYYRKISLIGNCLNNLKRYEEAIALNKEVMHFNIEHYGKSNTYFTSQSIQNYSISLQGLGRLDEALEYAHKSVCFFIGSDDTLNVYSTLEIPEKVSNNLSYLSLEHGYLRKIQVLMKMYEVNSDPKIINLILSHFEYLSKVVDISASLVQTVDGLAEISFHYKGYTNQLINFIQNKNLTQNEIETAYCLVSKSKSYSILVEEYQNKNFRDNLGINKQNIRKKELKGELLKISAKTESDLYYAYFEELVNIELEDYLNFIKNPVKTTNILTQKLSNQSKDVIFSNVSKDEVVIDFFVTKASIFAFVITSDSIKIVNRDFCTEFDENCNLLFRNIKLADNNRLLKVSESLYDFLLKDVNLSAKKRITIVPDEKLFIIPFEVLYNFNSFLVENYEVNYRYNSHIYRKPSMKKEFTEILAFVPWYDNDMISGLPDDVRDLYVDYTDENFQMRNLNHASLKASIEEVSAIQNIFSKLDIDVKIFKSKDANKQNFINNSKKADILHIATHGFADMNRPEYSGLLMYSESGSYFDNIILLAEISNLEFNADLVVLSACKSGYGSIVRGDGIMALSRGFISAGANNVLASLWKVHDEKTKEFMIKFYSFLAEGYTYSQALHLTKKHFIEQNWFPKDWAGFILIEA